MIFTHIMNLHLLRGRRCPIVFPPSGAFLAAIRDWIIRSLHSLMMELTYPQWYTRLTMLYLVTQVPRGSHDILARAILLVVLGLLLRLRHEYFINYYQTKCFRFNWRMYRFVGRYCTKKISLKWLMWCLISNINIFKTKKQSTPRSKDPIKITWVNTKEFDVKYYQVIWLQ